MAGKKSSGLGGALLLVIAGGVAFIASYAKEILVVGVIAALAWVAYKVFGKEPEPASPPPAPPPPVPPPRNPNSLPPQAATAPSLGISISIRGPGYVPGEPTSRNGDEYWQELTHDGKPLGASAYVGRGLAAVSGEGIEPALIDSSCTVDRSIRDCHTRRLGYWPSYGGAPPEARGAYLHWLATGLKDPDADLGYVFLYFYGLERRVLHDAAVSEVARGQVPAIVGEVERLLALYADSHSFQSYAGSLLDLLNNKSVDARLYERDPPPLRARRQLAFRHRIALGQCAADGAPLPAEWAYAWFISDPTAILRTPAIRCPDQFRTLFLIRYREVHGEGMVLPKNRTQLKMVRRPASPTFGWGFQGHTLQFDLPDVTVLTAPMRRLQEVADFCHERLGGYSRFVGKEGASTESFDAIVELPMALWPPAVRKPIDDVRTLVERAGKPVAVPLAKLKSWFPAWQVSTKRHWQSLSRALGEAGLGVEPDVRFDGTVPPPDTVVALFRDDPSTATSAPSANYRAAALTLQLAASVAMADDDSHDDEKSMMTRRLEEWLHLSESERRRLHAFLRRVLSAPPKLNGVRAKIEELTAAQREAIGDFLALVALADGSVTPDEIAALEKNFKLLGLDPKSVYSKVHVAATEPVTVRAGTKGSAGRAIPPPPPPPKKGPAGFALDPAKVALLQADSERVAALLGAIFSQPAPEPEPESAVSEPTAAEGEGQGLIGLDTEHSAFLRILLARAEWTRMELEELAEDRELMLDGALERVNDAAFEKLNKPLLEGDDPVAVNQEAAREVMQ